MGHYVICARCQGEVYTTGQRFPHHNTPHGGRCPAHGTLSENVAVEYGDSGAVDYNAGVPYQGGAWEQGKR